jgi:hypothetical protein
LRSFAEEEQLFITHNAEPLAEACEVLQNDLDTRRHRSEYGRLILPSLDAGNRIRMAINPNLIFSGDHRIILQTSDRKFEQCSDDGGSFCQRAQAGSRHEITQGNQLVSLGRRTGQVLGVDDNEKDGAMTGLK